MTVSDTSAKNFAVATGSCFSPDHARHENAWRENVLPFLVMFACGVVLLEEVIRHAWISDDAFITLRYVLNTLHGNGAVFNIGERVQGYTHPLWFLLLLPGCALPGDPILIAIGYGVVLTAATFVIWAHVLIRISGRPTVAALLMAGVSLSLLSSNIWLSFQTSGLENPLTHLLLVLIVAECALRGVSRPGRLTLILCLLCLTRPDLVLFCVPPGLLLLSRIRSWRALGAILIGILPCVAWLVFAWMYYGDIAPNTAYAKMGIFPNWWRSTLRGSIYLADWALHDTGAALLTIISLACVLLVRRSASLIACVCGVALHVFGVVWVGGDFMRGRFLLPAFVASIALASMSIALWYRERGNKRSIGTGVTANRNIAILSLSSLVVIAGIMSFVPDDVQWRDIVNERCFYPDYSLYHYLRTGKIECSYIDLEFAKDLREYVDRFGPMTIHLRNPGAMGYLTGPKVSIIDTLGLTDRFIARLPKEYLIDPEPRTGHPDKYIPVGYLAFRDDMSLLPDWMEAIRKKDTTLKERTRQFVNRPVYAGDARPDIVPGPPNLPDSRTWKDR